MLRCGDAIMRCKLHSLHILCIVAFADRYIPSAPMTIRIPFTPDPGVRVQENTMFEHKRKAVAAFAMAASFMMVLCAFAAAASGSNATTHTASDLTGSGYGDPNPITIAPGYEWSYNITFPDDLVAGITLDFKVNDLGDNARITVTDKGTEKATYTLTVKIPSGFTDGTYNVVLMAQHSASGQTETNKKAAYQWIKLTVNEEMGVSQSGALTQILIGASQNFNLVSTGGLGTVTWTFKEGGTTYGDFTIDGTKVTGECKTAGSVTLNFVATSTNGQTKDLKVTFTVYNKIVVGDNAEIKAFGGVGDKDTVLLSGVDQVGVDLNVTWAADKSLPSGLELDSSTGKITGSYNGTTAQKATITLTVSSDYPDPEGQTATKVVTIYCEPKLTYKTVDTVKSWTGNSVTENVIELTSNHSTVKNYALKSPSDDVSVDSTTGAVTLNATTVADRTGSVIVIVTTEYGQTVDVEVPYLVEAKLTVTKSNKLVSDAGHSNSISISITGPATWDYVLSDQEDGNPLKDTLTFNTETKELTLSQCMTLYSEEANKTVTITITSDAGQEEEISVQIVNYSALKFTSTPSATGIKVSVVS